MGLGRVHRPAPAMCAASHILDIRGQRSQYKPLVFDPPLDPDAA